MVMAQSIANVMAQKTALLRRQSCDSVRERRREVPVQRPKGLRRQSDHEEEGSESSEAPELVGI